MDNVLIILDKNVWAHASWFMKIQLMNDIFSGSLFLIESFGRSYNVDCSVAHEFYHLNDGLYLSSPEQISHAISPAIIISQVYRV